MRAQVMDKDGDICEIDTLAGVGIIRVENLNHDSIMAYTVEQAQQLITALQNAVIELQFGGEKNGR